MARAPLPIETWGEIRRTSTKAGTPAAIAYYRDLDGKRRRILRTGPTPAQAETNLKNALRERLAPSSTYLTAKSTLADLATQWLDDISKENKKSPGTIRRYTSVINSHLNEHVGAIRVSEATVPRLQRIIDLISEESVAQARMLAHVITQMLDMAVRHGAVKDNQARHLRLPARETQEVKVPTIDELATLRTLLHAYDGTPVARGNSLRDITDIADMMLATGARIGEVLALKWSDFNVEKWTVTIQGTLTAAPGKGLIRTKPKTRSSVRTLTLPKFILPMLSTRLQEALVEWVFPSAMGEARWPENVRRQWADALKGSAVEWITPHDLRKAVADSLGSEAAKEQLGHASITVTDKHYVEKRTMRPDQTHVLERFGNLKVANK